MNKNSDFSMKKKVDYFGLMEKNKSEIKLQSIEESENETVSINKITKDIVETPAIKARKAEINAAKDEIYFLRTNNETELKINKDVIRSNRESQRRSELINCKSVLEVVVGRRVY